MVRTPALAVMLVLTACADQQLALFSPLADAGGDGGEDAGTDAGRPFGVELVATGFQHACAIHEGALFCWGANASGELGLGDVQPRTRPTPLDAGTGWVEVGVGYDATCARKMDGTVWCWGDNTNGRLGQGPGGTRLVPGQVALPSPAVALSMHFAHACVIGADQVLRCWGYNNEGTLGLDDGFPGAGDQNLPVAVAGGGQWRSVSAGQGHTCGLRTDGSLWCWGRNSPPLLGQPMGTPGQLKLPARVGTDTDWAQVLATQSSTCALKTNGTLWCWGYVYTAQIGTVPDVFLPQRIGADSDWSGLAAETFSICALKTGTGALWCWGRNDEGQLGTGDTQSVYAPVRIGTGAFRSVAVGRFHHCAIDTGGGLACTGENGDGQLGLGDTMRRSVLTPVRF
jgi:alpha-tubulin suppressor-like RCC1 family protein